MLTKQQIFVRDQAILERILEKLTAALLVAEAHVEEHERYTSAYYNMLHNSIIVDTPNECGVVVVAIEGDYLAFTGAIADNTYAGSSECRALILLAQPDAFDKIVELSIELLTTQGYI